MKHTRQCTFTILILFLLTTFSAGASVERIKITKDTQADSPIKFMVTPVDLKNGQVLVELQIPPGQPELADLWKIFLWVIQDEKTVLGVPLELIHGEDKTITARYYGHVDTAKKCLIAIRCGKHAPRAETIYQIDIGSYLKSATEQGGAEQPATAVDSKSDGKEKSKPESKARSQ
jgi:hypothetical protein